ncbi:MAG: protein-L-isoaspartate(D-aspartate) O-methyltransferase [Desulfurivibrionaceae bacterium]|nr:protein-L-isoaspartate(D-aspartate) O-methyltransferase [Desulfurivibrionaceae bacterium]
MKQRAEVEQMLRTIQIECSYSSGATGINRISNRVMEAMAEVPRDRFVPDDMKPYAFDNRPLPIGNGQTISQPFIVALMTDLLLPEKDDVILEVGAGCGYQAVILARLVKRVHTVEIVPDLAREARARLATLGVRNAEVHQGDGYHGLPAYAPFDGIIVTAAADRVPEPLLMQLKPGGRLVIPVGPPHSLQFLMLYEKKRDGAIDSREVLAVAFVPLTGEHQG